MSVAPRWAIVFAVSAFVFVPTISLAQDEPPPASEEGEAPPEPELISEEPAVTSSIVPAVPVVNAEEVDEGPGAPFVYLAPTAMVVGAGVVIFTVVMYFVKVTRARYRLE